MAGVLKEWAAPGVVMAVIVAATAWTQMSISTVGGQVSQQAVRLQAIDEKIDRRGEATDRRVVETNQRIDTILATQASTSAQIGALQAEMAYIKGRIDKIADKLQVSAVEPVPGTDPDFVATLAKFIAQPTSASFEKAGLNVFKVNHIDKKALNAFTQEAPWARQLLLVTADEVLAQKIRSTLGPPDNR